MTDVQTVETRMRRRSTGATNAAKYSAVTAARSQLPSSTGLLASGEDDVQFAILMMFPYWEHRPWAAAPMMFIGLCCPFVQGLPNACDDVIKFKKR